MSTYLVFPLPPVTPGGQAGPHFRIKLQVRRNHPASNYGLGAVLVGREILDGHAFAYLRDCAGAWIESDDLPVVAGALGLSVQDIAPRADKGENMSIHLKNAVSYSESRPPIADSLYPYGAALVSGIRCPLHRARVLQNFYSKGTRR